MADATIAFNNTPHDSLDGLSPFFVYHGREYKTGLDSALKLTEQIYEPQHIIAKEMQERIKARNALIKKSHLMAKERRNHLHNIGISEATTFASGDQVLLDDKNITTHKRAGKKCKKFRRGPFLVLSTVKNMAVLSDINGKILRDLIPFRRLSHAKDLDDSCSFDSAIPAELICYLHETDKTRDKNGQIQRLYYPIEEGRILRKSAFWKNAQ